MTDAAPGDLKRIGFTLHGSLAVEMAMKLAMANRPQHTGPWLALTDGYHGRSLASMGLAGRTPTTRSTAPSRRCCGSRSPTPTGPGAARTMR